MAKSQFIPVLAIALELCLATASYAQNPPMNCTPDGIIEVCTLVNTDTPQTAVEAVKPPAPAVPLITYVNGQLTITAENVPLKEVLREVSRKTGAALEVPNGGGMEPVFANIGPGSVREVMVALLNGTKFNYVMLGSQQASSGLEKIVLTPADQAGEVPQGSALDTSAGVTMPQGKQARASTRLELAQAQANESPEQKKAEMSAAIEKARDAIQRNMARGFQVQQEQQARATESSTPDTAAAPDAAAAQTPAPDSSAPGSTTQQ
jgi:hypothetical protein